MLARKPDRAIAVNHAPTRWHVIHLHAKTYTTTPVITT